MRCKAPTSCSTTIWSTRRCSTACGATPKRCSSASARAQPGIGQDEINRRLVEAAQAGPQRRAAQGRRSLHLRPRRRGARSAAPAGHHRRRSCPASPRRSAARPRPACRSPSATRRRGCPSSPRNTRREARDSVDWSGSPIRDDHGRRLYGPCLGGRRARRPDRRRARSAHAGRRAGARHAAGFAQPWSARSTICRRSRRRSARGRRCSSIGEVVAHSRAWRDALELLHGGGRMTSPQQQKLKDQRVRWW